MLSLWNTRSNCSDRSRTLNFALFQAQPICFSNRNQKQPRRQFSSSLLDKEPSIRSRVGLDSVYCARTILSKTSCFARFGKFTSEVPSVLARFWLDGGTLR